jgi:anti-repressor protein
MKNTPAKTTARKPRDGRSIKQHVQDCSKQTMLAIGLRESEADAIIRGRRHFPYVEDDRAPNIDLRKVWEGIGKPYGKFALWVDRVVSDLFLHLENKSEVAISETSTKGRPRIDYFVSRHLAIELAMQVKTPQGAEVREYFYLQERLNVKLMAYMPLRADEAIKIDRAIYHTAISKTGNRFLATSAEIELKQLVCKVVSGISPAEWKERTGKSIRDSLKPSDLALYDDAYRLIQNLYSADMEITDITRIAAVSYGNKINPADYMH